MPPRPDELYTRILMKNMFYQQNVIAKCRMEAQINVDNSFESLKIYKTRAVVFDATQVEFHNNCFIFSTRCEQKKT